MATLEELLRNSSAIANVYYKSFAWARIQDLMFVRMNDFIVTDIETFTLFVTPTVFLLFVTVLTCLIYGITKGNLLGPTQRLLILIGMLEFLSIGLPSLGNGILYFAGKGQGIIEYDVCHVVIIMNTHVPNAIQSVCVWVKALMGFQRYYVINKPFRVRSFFTPTKYTAFFCIAIIFALGNESALTELSNVEKMIWVQDMDDKMINVEFIEGCYMKVSNKSPRFSFENVFVLIRTVVFGIIPTIILLVLDVKLYHDLRKQERMRKVMMSSPLMTSRIKLQRIVTYIGISFFFQGMVNNVVFCSVNMNLLFAGQYSYLADDRFQTIFHVLNMLLCCVLRPFDVIVYAAASKKFRMAFSCRHEKSPSKVQVFTSQ